MFYYLYIIYIIYMLYIVYILYINILYINIFYIYVQNIITSFSEDFPSHAFYWSCVCWLPVLRRMLQRWFFSARCPEYRGDHGRPAGKNLGVKAWKSCSKDLNIDD
jgi:hypothetical protein